MADAPRNYKKESPYDSVRKEIETKMQKIDFNTNGENTISQSDQNVLATVISNDLLENHTLAIAHLLKKLPVDDTGILRDDSQEAISGNIAAAKMIEQQEKANFIFRQVEKSKLDQIQNSKNQLKTFTLIHEIPPLGTNTEVKETAAKSLSDFTADEDSRPEIVEEKLDLFIERFLATCSSNKLSAEAAQALLYRKLAGTALQITKEHMAIQDPENEIEKLRMMLFSLEQRFLISASPVLAQAKLRKIQKNNLTFAQLQAKISKLAFYSVLDENINNRTRLAAEQGIAQFKLAISEPDRLLLQEEDKQRAKAEMPPLSLQGASVFLEHYYNQKTVYQAVASNSPESDKDFQFNNITQQNSNLQLKNGLPKYATKKDNRRYNQGFQRTNPQKYVTAESLGLAKDSCLLCGITGHKFAKCLRYPNTLPCPSICRHCYKGAHPHAQCKQATSYGQNKNKKTDQQRFGKFQKN